MVFDYDNYVNFSVSSLAVKGRYFELVFVYKALNGSVCRTELLSAFFLRARSASFLFISYHPSNYDANSSICRLPRSVWTCGDVDCNFFLSCFKCNLSRILFVIWLFFCSCFSFIHHQVECMANLDLKPRQP